MPELPLLIGEAPSRSGDRYSAFPLSGAVAERLLKLAGIERERESERRIEQLKLKGSKQLVAAYWTLTDRFDTMNLIERYPGARGRGAAFPLDQARAALAEQWQEIAEHNVIVLLGRRLPVAFGLPDDLPFYEWVWYARGANGEPYCARGEMPEPLQIGSRLVVIPHPSGLNKMYEQADVVAKAGDVLREAMRIAAA